MTGNQKMCSTPTAYSHKLLSAENTTKHVLHKSSSLAVMLLTM